MTKITSVNRKSVILLTIVFLGIGGVLSASYAFFIKYYKGNEMSYTTGSLQITLDTSETGYGDTINLNSAVAITDTEGLSTTPYKFKVKNTGTLAYKFDVKLISDTDKIETDNCSNNQISTNYIKVKTNNETPNTLNNFTDNKILENLTLEPNEEFEITLRIWLDESTPISEVGKHFHGKLTTDGIGAKPALYPSSAIPLAEGMIPVKYNGTTLVKADMTNTNNDWFNYDSKLWANAIMVTSTTRDTYMNTKQVGDAITESDVLAYYVWIPRYKYKLFNATFTTSSPQEIDIVFETINDSISNGSTNGEYLSHPAFWWDKDSDGVREAGEELEGIWIGKFETSSDTTCTATSKSVGTDCDVTTLSPRILPNITSWRGARVSTMFSATKKIESATYLTTNGVNQIDSHMMKNMEWGAVAYLSHSKYGKNSEITINDNSSYLTGGGAYKTNVDQSTTGNITGIYDISGGAWEYVMGVLQDNTNSNTPMSGNSTTYNSGFTGKVYASGSFSQYSGTAFPSKKYYDLYVFGTTRTDQTAYNRSHLGDATGETRAWYSDYAFFVYANYPWFFRGGYSDNGSDAGAFYFCNAYGSANASYSWRAVLASVSEAS